ncbi:Twinfilin-1 [Coemansia sp. RSA 2706]|nr:Twinfilin-1 [Coemansia sp. RSA 2705]KAJ2307405.1 Twinfilin-1 [Coemansia sp. RSA 2706]
MAHQSGIRVSEALAAQFRDALSAPVRVLQARIVDEAVEPGATQPQQGALLDDLDAVPALLDDTSPCYLLVQLDTGKWLFATYVPDAAPVRAKMLYASTKATVTKSLGESYFVDDMFGTMRDEFSARGYQQHRQHVESGAPLTDREQEAAHIRDLESRAAEAPTMDSRRSHVKGAVYPLHADAEAALREFARGTINFALLAIDTASETVNIAHAGSLQSHDELARSIPGDAPRYALYWFDSATTVFIYSCPASTSVRERMIYSTFRHGFTVTARELNINMDIRLEFDDPREITAAALEAEISERTAAPPPPAAQPKFKRPAPPNRRPRTKQA